MDKNSFEAQLLHTPFDKEDAYHSLSMPVYNTAAYEFDTAEAMEEAFCGRTADHAYSRITNPTVQYFEKRIRTITGALSVTALNSGMAAVSNVFITIRCEHCHLSPSVWQYLFFFQKYFSGIWSRSAFLRPYKSGRSP